MAQVTSVHKYKTPSSVRDYRTISILPTISKALKYIVFDQMLTYFSSCDLHKHQSGKTWRANKSPLFYNLIFSRYLTRLAMKICFSN
ncbi:hypothetical protein PR048_012900 [Dryococelus australis]|uniref:Uncharacterized protein n=1 Tax=Dryococelus australis TaxID=614101 RepID=A0ABQ9HS47_9NEOP|nr:hypothetical protein PR048_012900 [Dryococelus australis]